VNRRLSPFGGIAAAVLLSLSLAGPGKTEIAAPGVGPGYRLVASSFMDGPSDRTVKRDSEVRDVAVDKDGNIYIAGSTFPAAFVATRRINPPKRGPGGPRPDVDVLVIKLDPSGKLLWSALLGGPNHDRPYAIELGPDGAVYVAGRAGEGFPTTAGVVQPRFAGDFTGGLYGRQDGFVAKISADGRKLVWSTYFGGTGKGFIRDVDVDAYGQVHLAATEVDGQVSHITRDAFQTDRRGRSDAIYAKLSPDARKVLYATYLGGAQDGRHGDGQVPSVRVDRSGNAFVLAYSDAEDFPVTENALQPRKAGKQDLVIVKFDPVGKVLFSTFLGGSDDDVLETHHLALDGEGNPVIGGFTRSSDFPVTPRAYQKHHAGAMDILVAKLASDGSRVLSATYLGGSGDDINEGIAVTRDGEIVLSGHTRSQDFPVTANALQKRNRGDADALVVTLDGSLAQLRYATYIGRSRLDSGRSVAVGPDGSLVIGGETGSPDFPIVNGFDTRLDEEWSGVYFKLAR